MLFYPRGSWVSSGMLLLGSSGRGIGIRYSMIGHPELTGASTRVAQVERPVPQSVQGDRLRIEWVRRLGLATGRATSRPVPTRSRASYLGIPVGSGIDPERSCGNCYWRGGGPPPRGPLPDGSGLLVGVASRRPRGSAAEPAAPPRLGCALIPNADAQPVTQFLPEAGRLVCAFQ